jgi:hypothetical protein
MPANPRMLSSNPGHDVLGNTIGRSRRHTHRDGERADRPASSPRVKPCFAVFEGDTLLHDLLEEGLEKGRHRAMPSLEDDDEVLRRNDSEPRPGSLSDDQSQSPLALGVEPLTDGAAGPQIRRSRPASPLPGGNPAPEQGCVQVSSM